MGGKITFLLALATILTGCVVSSDPREGGLIGGLAGLHSGVYDYRVRQREEQLAGQQNANRDMADQALGLEREVQSRDRVLAEEQQRLAKIKGDVSRLESDVNHLNTRSSRMKKEVAALKRQVDDLWQRLQSQQAALNELDRAGDGIADMERYQMLQMERDRLAEEYRRLLEYSQTLSKAAN
jgi:chromosome segregation ATPase